MPLEVYAYWLGRLLRYPLTRPLFRSVGHVRPNSLVTRAASGLSTISRIFSPFFSLLTLLLLPLKTFSSSKRRFHSKQSPIIFVVHHVSKTCSSLDPLLSSIHEFYSNRTHLLRAALLRTSLRQQFVSSSLLGFSFK